MPGSVIVGSARTPIGKLSGALAGFSATDLGGLAIKAALERAGVGAEQVDYVLMGHVLLGRPGPDHRAPGGGEGRHPDDRSGDDDQQGVPLGHQRDLPRRPDDRGRRRRGRRRRRHGVDDQRALPAAGRACRLPHGQQRGRSTRSSTTVCGARSTRCTWAPAPRTTSARSAASPARPQDELAAKSHERAAAAQKEGRFADEITPVSIPQRKGDPVVVETDEGVRPGTTTESLGGLRPAFSKDGTITAGNASQISDGAAAVIVMSKAKAEELGATPLAELIGYGMVAGPDPSLLTQPSRAIKRALERDDMTASDVDLFELNEAFAAVGIASMRDLGISDDIVNVNGGAIALGHPIGMSGTRVVLTLINELRRRGGGVGAAALCGGGGQGDAAIIRTL